MLSNEDFEDYLTKLDASQADCVRTLRTIIRQSETALTEEIDAGKWFGGLLTYYTEDRIHAFALGPRKGGFTTFHMMPYYGSNALQERHGLALKSFLSGKSCVKFKVASQIPIDAIQDIVGSTPKYAELARAMVANRKK